MRCTRLALEILCSIILGFSAVLITSFQPPQPHGKLIVLIAVDGLGGKLLEKFKPAFGFGFKRMFDEGMNFKDAWDNHAMVRLKENTIMDLDADIHGSPYDYDRYVPLLFMGMGIKKGASDKRVYTVDVAPTLAAIAGLKVSGKTDGKTVL